MRSVFPRPGAALTAAITAALTACAPPPPATPARQPEPAAPVPPPAVAIEAPSSAAPAPPAPPPGEVALATHRAFFDALRAHDAAGLASLYAPDAVVDVGVGATVARGPDAVAALASTLTRAFPDAKVQWSTLVQAKGALAVELAWTGTETGPLGELPPTKRVLGAHALLLEHVDPAGHLHAQHLYVDTATWLAEVAPRSGKPHPFDGLPTSQVVLADGATVSAEDDAAMKAMVASFRRGAFVDAPPLATNDTTWTDATKGRTVRGKGGVLAWTAFLEHAFRGGGERLVDAWSAGAYQVLEWSTAPGDAVEAHAAEIVRFSDGHLAEVRTYRAPAKDAAPRKPRPSG